MMFGFTLEAFAASVNPSADKASVEAGESVTVTLTLDEALKTTTQRLSPYIRQRLTFMRLLKFYDFYDEITEG